MYAGTLNMRNKQPANCTQDGIANSLDPRLRFSFEPGSSPKLTHYLFRYPAKFHPPIARTLVDRYSEPGDWILDPFCGSGTVLVEAAVRGRNAIGTDWDPVAVFVSRIKTHKFHVGRLRTSCSKLMSALVYVERSEPEYEERQWRDLTDRQFHSTVSAENLWIPDIPNLGHWFRKYVIIDLARILRSIISADAPSTHKDFLLLCFASMIRSCSNADPVPVSGLEVTSFMREKDERGRIINPFETFRSTTRNALAAVDNFSSLRSINTTIVTRRLDATACASSIRRKVDCVITSPPYFSAVDYYRRHQLEMYWLGFTQSHEERKKLIPSYIGRQRVSSRHPFLGEPDEFGVLCKDWMAELREHSVQKANSFKHYCVSMRKFFEQLERIVRPNGKAVIVVGNSKVAGSEMPVADLLVEIADPGYKLAARYWYPLKNRYMSYGRRNGADINTEHVLVFEHASS